MRVSSSDEEVFGIRAVQDTVRGLSQDPISEATVKRQGEVRQQPPADDKEFASTLLGPAVCYRRAVSSAVVFVVLQRDIALLASPILAVGLLDLCVRLKPARSRQAHPVRLS